MNNNDIDLKIINYLDEHFGKDNWWIRKVSSNNRNEPSLTLSSIYLKKIGLNVGDKVLVVTEGDKIVIRKV